VSDDRRIAIVANTTSYVGPDLARALARRGHDLVVGDPAEGLVDELTGMGATVEVVTGVHDLGKPEAAPALVQAAVDRFGRIDSAVAASGRIVVGRFLKSGIEDLQAAVRGCLEAPYHFLRAVVPVMVERGEGQVLVITSASGARPTPGAPLYSSARAGANMLVRNVAGEVAATGVQVNAVGTNFMDFPEFLEANRATDAEGRARVEAQVPMKRLGGLDEFASFCMPFLDGTSRFTTGQFVAYAGGWV
jgi:3-oxoacyl-[acyl-carrier protein] reductase